MPYLGITRCSFYFSREATGLKEAGTARHHSSRSRTEYPEGPSGICSLDYPMKSPLGPWRSTSQPLSISHSSLPSGFCIWPHLPPIQMPSSFTVQLEAYRLRPRHSQLPRPSTPLLFTCTTILRTIIFHSSYNCPLLIQLKSYQINRKHLKSWDKLYPVALPVLRGP